MPLFALLLAFVGACLYIAFEQNNVISISNLSLLLGGFLVAVAGYTLAKPAEVGQALKTFPRANAPGYVLMLAATAWFLWNIKTEDMEDYVNLKSYFYIGFGAVGVGSCIYLRDFLAVRGLAVFLLLLANLPYELLPDGSLWDECINGKGILDSHNLMKLSISSGQASRTCKDLAAHEQT